MHPAAWLRILICLGALGVASANEPPATDRPGSPPEAGAATTGLAVARPALREVILSGFTRAKAELPLVSETSGRILDVGWDIGDTVSGNKPFARIDDTFLLLDLDRVHVEQDRLEAQVKFDRREVERYRELALQRNASASQLDTLEQTQRNDTHALQTLGVERKVLEERLQRTSIYAPDGWRITARDIEPGQWVREGDTVGRAADFSTLLVPFALTPEQLVSLQSRTDKLALYLPDLGREVGARIYRSNPGFDEVTRKIAVDLAITETVEPTRGGLRAQLRLPLPERTGAVTLPRTAVENSYEEHWVTRDDGKRLRVMLLGPDGDDPERVRISAPGIQPDDRFRLTEGG